MNQVQSGARFGRLFVEFLLIVAGVSVALAADAFWEFRTEVQREAEYLGQIRSDLTENERRLLAALEDEDMIEASVQRAIDAFVLAQSVSPDSAQAWFHTRRGLNYADPRLLTGTIDALISTGDLRLIRDPSVRQGLMSYLPKIEQDRAEFDRWVGLGVDHVEQLRIIGLRASPDGVRPDFPANAALTHARREPEVLEALHGLLQKHRVRQVYLERMLESSRSLSELLQSVG